MQALEDVARVLHVDFDALHDGWIRDFPRRMRGEFATVSDNLASILTRMGADPDGVSLDAAEQMYVEFAMDGLIPKEGAIEFLQWLRMRGIPTGLVSNCAPEVVKVWEHTSMASYFTYCAFSCRERVVKPDREIYQRTLQAIGSAPSRTLYIGDGSDEELTGALRCGMHAVLYLEDLSNTYDRQRADVDTWHGPTVGSFNELQTMLPSVEPRS